MDNLEKNLNALAEMLKKRGNTDFKHDLRNKLIRKANELNEKPVAATPEKERSVLKMPSWFGKALVPATATVLAVAVLFYAVLPGGKVLKPISIVDIAQANDYYVLTPDSEDSSGIDSSSGFTLESQGEVSAEDVEDNLIITPEVPVTVDQEDPNTVTIQPVDPLEAGEVYSVTLEAQNIEDSPYKTEYSWAYQVTDEFRVASTIPGNKTAGVPINNGVEITFNYNGVSADDFKNYFSIEPAVDGSFEANGKYGVFLPETLAPATVYTVTIKQGLPLAGTDKVLSSDYTFMFETSTDTYGESNFNLSYDVYEFTSTDTPYLTGYYWDWNYGNELTDVNTTLTVYQFASGEDYLKALKERDMSSLDWSYYAASNYEIPTDGLSQVIAPSDVPFTQGYYDRAVIFPQTLPEGYYLAEVEISGEKEQALIQITPIGSYFSVGVTSSLVWVNDMTTGQPINGAEVEFLDGDKASTDSDGIAFFEDLPYKDFIKKGNSDYTAYGYLKISYDEHEAYYSIDSYFNDDFADNASGDYWQFLKTERGTYHPNDTLNYWGFVKGRDKSARGEAEIMITDAPWYLSMDWLSDYGTVYYEENVDLEDGGVVSGSIQLEKLMPGSYGLWVVQDDKVITSTIFSVEDYIKPSYQLIVTPEKNVLWNGESMNINVRAEFFDGTPAPNVAINAGNNGVSYTDENGEFDIAYTATPYECSTDSLSFKSYCELFPTDYQSFYTTGEESGEIWDETRITMIRSKIGAYGIEADHDNLSFETKYVDYDKVVHEMENSGWVWQNGDVHGDNAASAQVLISVVRYDQKKVEQGTYYDYINKVVRTSYFYEDVDVAVSEETVYSDANGKVEYNLGLDTNSSYTVNITVYDADGNFYTDSTYLTGDAYESDYFENKYIYFNITDYNKKYDVSEDVNLELAANGDLDLLSDGTYKYLYIESIDGALKYEISTDPNYSFTFTEDMIPSMMVTPVLFDGRYFIESGSTSIQYDYEKERLNIDIMPDKDSYEPGETAKISFEITDSQTGNNADGYLNVYLVDEAYYSLYDESLMDPLVQLYGSGGGSIIYTYASHQDLIMAEDYGRGGCFKEGTKILMSDGSYKNIEDIVVGDLIKTRAGELNDNLVTAEVLKTYEHTVSKYISVNDGELEVTPEHVIFLNGKWNLAQNLKVGDYLLDADGEKVWVDSVDIVNAPTNVYNFEVETYHTYFADNIYVHNDKGGMRENFQDTALFATVETDDGEAEVEFTLPDNITSWRVVATIVNKDLQGGFNSSNIVVTKPAFVLPVLNTEYLTGDNPIIPLRVYGSDLASGDSVIAGVEYAGAGYAEYSQEQDGTAFSTMYFDLGTLAKGLYEIISYAETDAGDDAVSLEINVVDSHLSTEHIWDSVLSENLSLEGSTTQRTDVSFMNNEVGPIYNALISAATDYGDRADQKAANYTARELLNEYFEDELTIYDFPITTYQISNFYSGYGNDSGAIRLLPYGDGELELTAKLAALNPDLWSQEALLNYFEKVLNTGTDVENEGVGYTLSEKILAIYGASALSESYLNELNYFVSNYDLSVEDKLYAALAYLNMGDRSAATDLYLDVISNNSDSVDDYVKITSSDATDDDELTWTAWTALLAAELGDDRHQDFWDYVTTFEGRESVNTDLQSIEKIMYASTVLKLGAESEVTFKLNGEKITLENNELYQVSMTPDELANAEFGDLSGEIMVFTRYSEETSLDEMTTDDRVTIERTYSVNGVDTTEFHPGDLVKIEFTIKMPASTYFGYNVKDYLPSGLKPVLRYSSYYTEDTSGDYRLPYQVLGQEMSFFSACWATKKSDSCTDSFYYYARVINKGEFVTEPAIVQNYENPDIMNVSGDRGSVTVSGDMVIPTEASSENSLDNCEATTCYYDETGDATTCWCDE